MKHVLVFLLCLPVVAAAAESERMSGFRFGSVLDFPGTYKVFGDMDAKLGVGLEVEYNHEIGEGVLVGGGVQLQFNRGISDAGEGFDPEFRFTTVYGRVGYGISSSRLNIEPFAKVGYCLNVDGNDDFLSVSPHVDGRGLFGVGIDFIPKAYPLYVGFGYEEIFGEILAFELQSSGIYSKDQTINYSRFVFRIGVYLS